MALRDDDDDLEVPEPGGTAGNTPASSRAASPAPASPVPTEEYTGPASPAPTEEMEATQPDTEA